MIEAFMISTYALVVVTGDCIRILYTEPDGRFGEEVQ